jgi:hypothetical protein
MAVIARAGGRIARVWSGSGADTLSVADLPRASDRGAACGASSCVRRYSCSGLPRNADPNRSGAGSRSGRCRGEHRRWVSTATRDDHVYAWPSGPVCSHTSHNDHLAPESFPRRLSEHRRQDALLGQVRERPGDRLAWRGRVPSYHARGHNASRSAQVFPTFWRSLRHSENRRPGNALCFLLFVLRSAPLSICSTRPPR